MFKWFRSEIKSIMSRDPAARNGFEVFFLYPGFHAIIYYKIAHWFHTRGMKFIGRLISQTCRIFTGIEIHPGATIGKRLFIDHGMGVVIGETVVIGNNVTIYQGVTLGGTGKETGKRHPNIGDGVVISTGAKVLGPFNVGDYSKIGAGAVVLKEVPPNSTVVGIPGRVVKQDNVRKPTLTSLNDVDCQQVDLDQVRLPDPVAEAFLCLRERVTELEKQMEEMEAIKKDEAI